MVLVDTSVWVDHLRQGDRELAALLLAGEVVCHPFVVGELACGGIRNRESFFALVSALPMLVKVEDAEVIDLINRRGLMGNGLGVIDIHLLASCVLEGARLWTRDRKLAETATRLGCGF